MSETVEVSLMILPPSEYETILTDDGRKLTDLYPHRLIVLIVDGQPVECVGELTDNMRDLFAGTEVEREIARWGVV